jgi:uncharacterized membrane protein
MKFFLTLALTLMPAIALAGGDAYYEPLGCDGLAGGLWMFVKLVIAALALLMLIFFILDVAGVKFDDKDKKKEKGP